MLYPENIDPAMILNEPFGSVGAEVASYAGDLINYLSTEPEVLGDRSLVMPEYDCQALGDWLEIEEAIPMMEVVISAEIMGPVKKKANDALFALHTALPFSEAERGWLIQLFRQLHVPSIEALPGMIETQEAQIISAGVKRVVTGRDLMRRWTAWRRETDEFVGQGSLDQAREALQSMQGLLS
jgi:hypothetical protein